MIFICFEKKKILFLIRGFEILEFFTLVGYLIRTKSELGRM